jgi:hypothetical protein
MGDEGVVPDDLEPWVFGLAVAILVGVFFRTLRVPDAGPATVPLRIAALAISLLLGVVRYRMTEEPSWLAVWGWLAIVLVVAGVVWTRCDEARRAAKRRSKTTPDAG